jgi:aspartyl-tRNA(Asn)/glutamyl-tRNA(Gln) amidotransferase subunit A
MSADLTRMGVAALGRALHARQVSAVEVLDAHLERIAAENGDRRAFAVRTETAARAAARAADATLARGEGGALTGIPVAVKDNMAVTGIVRGNGSAACTADAAARTDAGCVARLRAAGAVVLGTTHMTELAFNPHGLNPHLGTPANPWGVDHMPGGSSSGSGVAVAAGLAAAALGSDTGGSVRIPASLCGVTGLKPTWGRVSRAGVTPLAWSLDHVGPIGRSVEDVALVLETIAGADADDPTAARLPVPRYASLVDRPLAGLRVGVLRAFGWARLGADVGATVDAALGELGRVGVRLRDVVVPALAHAMEALSAILLPEADRSLRPMLGARIDAVGIEGRMLLEMSKLVSARHYLAAGQVRAQLYAELRAALAEADLLVLPTTPVAAPRVDEQFVALGESMASVTEVLASLTGPFNLSGLPALALPCGVTAGGMPVSLQLVGRPFGEVAVLAAGAAWQRETDWHHRLPH